MKRRWKITAAVLVLVPAVAVGTIAWIAHRDYAAPTAEALAAVASTEAVEVSFDDWFVLRPAKTAPTTGFILYPGANCDVRGYAQLLREIAAAGYLAVAVPMPFNQAVFDPNEATNVMEAFPEIEHWVIAGHSLGGAMASRYAFHHQDELAGLILWDSYPAGANSLADSSLPVANIYRATLEGEAPEKFQQAHHLLPAGVVDVPIRGGIHMYFGSFDGGGYDEVWEPSITRDEQHRQLVRATLDALASMGAPNEVSPNGGSPAAQPAS